MKLEQRAEAANVGVDRSQQKKGKKRKNMGTISNGSGGEHPYVMDVDDDVNAVNQRQEIGQISNKNQTQLMSKLEELIDTNRNIYQYSINHFFENLSGNK